MSKYLIYACDNQYEGLHGVEDWGVYECESYDEACEIGHELSYDLITSYEFIEQKFEEKVQEQLLEEGLTEDHLDYDNLYDDWMDALIEEDVCYQIYKVKDDINYDSIIQNDTDWTEIRDSYSVKGD